jgi:hypothetical protein
VSAAAVDLDAMIRAAQEVDWSGWQPDPADQTLTTRVSDAEPPLTAWLVQQLVDFVEWIAGRTLTPEEVAAQQQALIELWTRASVEMDYSAVHVARANVALWQQIIRLPADQQEIVREELRRRNAAASAEAAAERDAEALPKPLTPEAMRGKLIGDLIGGPKPPGFF